MKHCLIMAGFDQHLLLPNDQIFRDFDAMIQKKKGNIK